MNTFLRIAIFWCAVSGVCAAQSGSRPGFVAASRLVVDTLTSAILTEPCAENFQIFGVVIGQGFVTGANSDGDRLKLQRIERGSTEPVRVTSVGVAFAPFQGNIADRKLRVELYADTTASDTIGRLIAVSDSVRVGDFTQPGRNGSYTNFTFPEPLLLEESSFLVGVNFDEAYAESDTGYVGIYHTNPGCGDGTNVIEGIPDASGTLRYTTLADNRAGLNVELFIRVVVDTETDPNPVFNLPTADYAASVSPNPARASATLSFQTGSSGSYTVGLTDPTGRNVFRKRVPASGGGAQVQWELSILPAGLYIYHIDGPAGRQSGKLIVR
ncbi:T9SS type A sorting domain-containing protein [Lewinella sp. IMCC34183]|uniref:T9SS type A sorting domain-containing protein n=1 Tax=Lewinella sp. IMCC34183 TaxID=2248762 RepID=UPI000E25E17C|nr:T9SS type A sorting domain-containing protein [Lewinella sp. IMCC34183]